MTKRELAEAVNSTHVNYINQSADKEEALLNAMEVLMENLSDVLSWIGYYYGNTKGMMIVQTRELMDQLEEISVEKFDDITA